MASVSVHVVLAVCLHWSGRAAFALPKPDADKPTLTMETSEPLVYVDIVDVPTRARAQPAPTPTAASTSTSTRTSTSTSTSTSTRTSTSTSTRTRTRTTTNTPPTAPSPPHSIASTSPAIETPTRRPELTPLQKEMRLARTAPPAPKITPFSLTLPFDLKDWTKSEMIPSGGGTKFKDQQGWSATISPDGTVKFKDKPSFEAKLVGPCISCIKKGLRRYAKNPESAKTKPVPFVIIPMLVGKFDVTDWLMRKFKQDPYSFQKAQFLERTRGERMLMAAGEKSENLRNSMFSFRRNLTAVWTNTSWSKQKRRALLFQLWDECAETGTREVLASAAGIRTTIMAFIRRHMPAGSSSAYTVPELKRLNARKKSRALFTPYER